MGERDLAAAILRRAWQDVGAAHPLVRHEALQFWGTPKAVLFWDDLLNLDGALLRHAAALPTAGPWEALPCQLPLFWKEA
jgi:hypothetical protein